MYAHLIAETTAQINERFPMELQNIDIDSVLLFVIGSVIGVLIHCCIKDS